MKRTTIQPTLLMALSLILSSMWADGAVAKAWPPAQTLDVKHVALFKNGLGFFVAEATCPAGRTEFRLALPAAPSHGTFWISYPAGVDLASAVAREVESDEVRDAVTIVELLRANEGRDVELAMGDHEIRGTIAHFAENRDMARPNPYAPGGRTGETPSVEPWRVPQASLVMIQTDAGMLCINPHSVTRIMFPGASMERSFARPVKKVELEVRLRQAAPSRKLTLTFLAKGLTWAPSYVVDITDEERGRLAAKAVIVNDACELKEVAVQLVTGFPHLQFSDVVSPVGMKESLAQFLQALPRGQSGQGRPGIMDNVMTQSVTYRGRMGGMGGGVMPEYGATEVGTVAEDLFLYPAGQVSMSSGEVAYIPLFTETVPYEHIYEWDIPDYVDAQGRYDYNRGREEDQGAEQEVWHSLRLSNTTKVPWTTAPGETIKARAILGQDTLEYTPSGADTTLRITRAVGVKADQVERETSRKRDAMQLYGYHYDLVTVRGELSVVNAQNKAIRMEITKTLSGAVKSVEPDAKQEKLAQGLRRMNGLTKLTWTIELAPEAEKRLSYVYDVYVRR
ncbi:MAG: hypothetical protein ACYTAS_17280 [Planctomycetota bacterium]